MSVRALWIQVGLLFAVLYLALLWARPMITPDEARYGAMGADMLAKNDMVIDGGLKSLEICKRAGVKVGYGSDLLGQLMIDQSREFLLRSEVLSPIEIIRQATLVGAEVVRMEGKLGCVAPGAFADLIVVDGNRFQTPRRGPRW